MSMLKDLPCQCTVFLYNRQPYTITVMIDNLVLHSRWKFFHVSGLFLIQHTVMTAMPSLMDTEIPVDARKHLLPHHNMSVIEFLKFSLPTPQLNTAFTTPNQYLSPSQPNTMDIQDIQHLRIPLIPIIKSLVKAIDPSVHQSVECPHMGTTNSKRYPLWVIQYWAELIPIHTDHQKWVDAEDSLQKQTQS